MSSDAPLDTASFIQKDFDKGIAVSYNTRDLLTYAVGIGCSELRYVYEHDEDFQAFPTYPIVLGFKGTDQDVVDFPSEAMQEAGNLPPLSGIRTVLDGERYIEKVTPLDVDGAELRLQSRLIGVHKRGSGASIETESQLVDASGKVYYKFVSGAFAVGAKNFKDGGVSFSSKVPVPSRAPDKVSEFKTNPFQTHVYRLSGDYNPLHIDPEQAQAFGFKEPILHGLCSLGVTARAVLNAYADGDADRFKAMKLRFSKPVIPGQTIVTEMWKEGSRIIFVGKVKETGAVVVSNSYVDLEPEERARL